MARAVVVSAGTVSGPSTSVAADDGRIATGTSRGSGRRSRRDEGSAAIGVA